MVIQDNTCEGQGNLLPEFLGRRFNSKEYLWKTSLNPIKVGANHNMTLKGPIWIIVNV